MTIHTAEDKQEAQRVAGIIAQQISNSVLMSLGAKPQLMSTIFEGKPGLVFRARILPFNQDGTRSVRPALMLVFIALDWGDTYIVCVEHKGKEHARTNQVYCDQLNGVLLALDFDGEEPFNPRYMH